MLDRSLSEVSASWDPLSFEEPADNGIPTHTTLEMCAELEEPGWLPIEDDKMFWGDEQPQSVASVMEASPTVTASHSPADKGQQVDSSFMSCGSSQDTLGRFMMFSGDEGTVSPAPVSHTRQSSQPDTESLAREVLVINGLPLEARATAMGVWMNKVQRYGGDVYNQVVQRSVAMLSTMRANPLSGSDKAGSGCLDQPSSSDSERSGYKRSRSDEVDPSSASWQTSLGAVSKRSRRHARGFSSDFESEGTHFALNQPSSLMISTPSTQDSRAFTSSQQFTLAEMDQQLNSLMSDEPLLNQPSALFSDPFSVNALASGPFANDDRVSLPRLNSNRMDFACLDSSALHIDDVAPGEDLPPIFMQALHSMCNDGGQLVDL